MNALGVAEQESLVKEKLENDAAAVVEQQQQQQQEEEEDEETGMPEWIRVYDPRNLSYYYFNNMNKAIVHDGERDARGKWLAPRHFEDSWRIGDEMIHPEILGAFRIQSMLRRHWARSVVRVRRAYVAASGMKAVAENASPWIELMDPQLECMYYFARAGEFEGEIRFRKPASYWLRPAEDMKVTLDDLSLNIAAAANVELWKKRHPRAKEAIANASRLLKVALRKVSVAYDTVRSSSINDVCSDTEELEATLEMLERATKTAIAGEEDMRVVLSNAHADVLETFSEVCEDLSRRTVSEKAEKWPQQLRDDLRDMAREVEAAVTATLAWWSELREEIPQENLVYLFPQLAATGNVEQIPRENHFPAHPVVESLDKRLELLEECVREAELDVDKIQERLREAEELSTMRSEEAVQRVMLRREKRDAHAWHAKQAELSKLRAAWKVGIQLRREDMEKQMESRGGASSSSSSAANSTEEKYSWTRRGRSRSAYDSPWEGAERGCSPETMLALVQEESRRRKFQEQRSGGFHVDDPEHGTGRRLLHTASFWGHLPLVSLLLDLGADPRQRDSMVTKFTPLDEAARGGSHNVVNALLEAGAAYTVFHKNLHGDTPVHTASREGHVKVLEVIIDFFRQAESDKLKRIVGAKNGKGRTPIQVAASDACRDILIDAAGIASIGEIGPGPFVGSSGRGLRLPALQHEKQWVAAPRMHMAVIPSSAGKS
eukprot:g1853.t1